MDREIATSQEKLWAFQNRGGMITGGVGFQFGATISTSWDFGSGKANFYINGEEAASSDGLGKFPALTPKARIGFNAESGYKAADNGANGIIDEFAIYDKALSPDEIKRDMKQLAYSVEPDHKLATVWGNIKW